MTFWQRAWLELKKVVEFVVPAMFWVVVLSAIIATVLYAVGLAAGVL